MLNWISLCLVSLIIYFCSFESSALLDPKSRREVRGLKYWNNPIETPFMDAKSSQGCEFMSHDEALMQVQEAGIQVSSSGACSDRNNPKCTSLDQIRCNTIDNACILKSASGCSLIITGGTETGHASGTYSHWNGYKLDYGRNDCLYNYIENNFAFIGNRPGDGAPQYKSAAGNIYALEGNHWDVIYYNLSN